MLSKKIGIFKDVSAIGSSEYEDGGRAFQCGKACSALRVLQDAVLDSEQPLKGAHLSVQDRALVLMDGHKANEETVFHFPVCNGCTLAGECASTAGVQWRY